MKYYISYFSRQAFKNFRNSIATISVETADSLDKNASSKELVILQPYD